ncbi:hypothetical protein F3Y22_tig00112611pilonHSYRG00019 [Hibiscus syriacus]|uniref:Uncharacterized protein n=1 Tax=Hibiscus syriacus TaxID=106335 RepID=A0A6A2Y7M0_HIBSY|nr:hypothetical protein F3Y22_tig00112611pilonHSYRG00019 [Hibiscus syriacus]
MASRNLTTDQSSLLEFKDRIVGPQTVLATNWTISSSVCNWIGVSCGVIHERVIALNLTDMNLNGTIPPHLGNLSFLLSLDLGGNNFHGHLPEELGQLHRLRLMDVRLNSFNGEIPSSIGKCSNLQSLVLYSNAFSGIIPRSIGNLTRLKELYLGSNPLGSSNLKGMCFS